MTDTSRLWKVLGAILLLSFGLLLFMGREIYLAAPPMPNALKSASGQTLYTLEDLHTGREVWQTTGGQQLGSIWGHGGYVAPDWSADWLHREATGLLDLWAKRDHAKGYAELDRRQQASLQARLQDEMRANTYDAATGVITVSDDRAAVIQEVAKHYKGLFGPDIELNTLRAQYAMGRNPVPDPARRQAMTGFFWWTSWATVTNRPSDTITYTSNWPSEPLVGNVPTGPTYMWTFISILVMLGGIGGLVWIYAMTRREEEHPVVPDSDPLKALVATPSMKATAKYFWIVTALIVTQVILGGITAHYAVEGPGVLRLPAGGLPAVCRDAQLAPAARGAVDRDSVARHGSLHRPGDLGTRAKVPAARRELPVHLPAGHRGRRTRRPVVRRHAEDGPRRELLVRPPGLRVHGHRPVLADLPVHRPDALARPGRSRVVARAPEARRQPFDHDAAVPLDDRHRTLLRCRPHVGPQHAPVDGRVLALVGSAPVGRRLLRGLRHGRHRLPVHQARPGPREAGHDRGAVRDRGLPYGRRAGHVPSPLLVRHTDGRAGAGRLVLGTRSGPLGADRLRRLRELPPQQSEALGRRVQVADPVLRLRGVLEPRRRGPLRLPDQPPAGALLHAGPQHDSAARPHGALRRLRHARHRLDAVLSAWAGPQGLLGRQAARRCVLDAEHRTRGDGPAVAGADWTTCRYRRPSPTASGTRALQSSCSSR